jgi:ComF family protein
MAQFAQPRPRCGRCALPVAAGVPVCGRCLVTAPPLDACHAAVSYEFPWSALIVRYKFNGEPGWAGSFAALMRGSPCVEAALQEADLVLPVPLSPRRASERGFNQALLLARSVAPAKTEPRLLIRVRHTPAQTGLDLKARLRNVDGAFAVDPLLRERLRGRKVVLVDDVMTSGASLFAAARAVRESGAERITGLVLARTADAH